MLNMKMETSIRSIPFLCSMDRADKIEAVIKDFIKCYNRGYDINAYKYDILKEHGLSENLLTDAECEYIKKSVERKIK